MLGLGVCTWVCMLGRECICTRVFKMLEKTLQPKVEGEMILKTTTYMRQAGKVGDLCVSDLNSNCKGVPAINGPLCSIVSLN